MADNSLPPLPPGFTLDQQPQAAGGLPPLPAGFTLDAPPHPGPLNPATDFGGNTVQVWNPATLWNPQARNFDTGIPIGQGTQNFLAGAGKATEDLGRGAHQVYAQVADKVDGGDRSAAIQSDIDESRRFDQPLMNTGSGKAGYITGNVVDTLPAAGLGGPVTSGAALGGLQPIATGESRLHNVEVGALSGLAGKTLGAAGTLLKPATNAVDAAAASQAGRQLTARVLQDGQNIGLEAPPALANPTLTNTLASALAGKGKIAQTLSAANQDTATSIAKRVVGLTDADTLSPQALQEIRTNVAGKAYQDLRAAGNVAADDTHMAQTQAVINKYSGVERDFPGTPPSPLIAEAKSLQQPSFDASSAVTKIQQLRDSASSAARSGDNGLAAGYKQLANTLEGTLQRGLSGNPQTAGLVPAYQQARTLMAQTRSIEDALNADGTVSGKALAGQLKAGEPLSGDLKTVAEFASHFGKAFQPAGNLTGPGGHTGLWGPGIAALEGFREFGPKGIALGAALPAIRGAATKWAQSPLGQAAAMPNTAATPLRDALAAALHGATNNAPVNAARSGLSSLATNPATKQALLAAALANAQAGRQPPQQ